MTPAPGQFESPTALVSGNVTRTTVPDHHISVVAHADDRRDANTSVSPQDDNPTRSACTRAVDRQGGGPAQGIEVFLRLEWPFLDLAWPATLTSRFGGKRIGSACAGVWNGGLGLGIVSVCSQWG